METIIQINWRKGHQTRIENSGSLEASYKAQQSRYQHHCLNKYGVSNPAKPDAIKLKIKASTQETFQARYGVDCYWLKSDVRKSTSSKDSSYNLAFAKLLDDMLLTILEKLQWCLYLRFLY